MNQSERQIHRNEFIRINKKFESKYFGKVHKAIKSKVSSLIDVIRESGIDAAQRSLQTDLTNVQLSKVVEQMYKEVGLRYARKEWRRQRAEIRAIGFPKRQAKHLKSLTTGGLAEKSLIETKGLGFNEQWIAFILQYLQQFLIEKITFTVNETTREKLLDVLQEGIAEGMGIEEMVNRLEDLPFTRTQAARITRTEINRAANVGTMAGVSTGEYEMNKEWIAAHDHRTRGTNPEDEASHVNLDAQVIGFDEKFKDSRNGDLLEFPGDPNASAASVVNCRCSVAPIAKRDQNGFLVPKPQPAQVIPIGGVRQIPIAARPFQFVLRGNA